MAAIQIQSLTKRYGDVTAVEDLNLVVDDGEVFGFLGPNGAGKSTTINVLLDLVRPTSGTVSILGHDVRSEQRAIRERIGVLPEATGYYERATARSHLEFAIAMKRTDDDPDEILDRVGLRAEANERVGGFSKGMRQRLGLGIALVGSPDVLILDEPLSGLDPAGAERLRTVVRKERNRGTAVFFSSHIMDQVESLCDRIGIVDDGELVATGTVEQLRERIGHRDRLAVSVEAVPSADDVAEIDGVTAVDRRDGTLEVTCTEGSAKAAVISRLESDGATVRDVETERPSLEEVFMTVTGSEADA